MSAVAPRMPPKKVQLNFQSFGNHSPILAPDAAPINSSVTTRTATSLTICFEFPDGISQNGQIHSLNITLLGFPFETDLHSVEIPVTSTDYPITGPMCGRVKDLQEYNNYTIVIVLVNSAGSGPDSTPIDVRTLETGNYYLSPIEE